ncbi:hypothetical protein VPH35_053763 [Triticum aestivum]
MSGGCSWCSTGRARTYDFRGRSSAHRHPSLRPPPSPSGARRLTGRIRSIWTHRYHIPRVADAPALTPSPSTCWRATRVDARHDLDVAPPQQPDATHESATG